jgi:signal transduction histidine kinase
MLLMCLRICKASDQNFFWHTFVSIHALLNIHFKRINELMDAKNKIHSIIGHDLRAPFNTLIGFSDLLIENLKEEGQLENRKYAEVLKRISVKNLELLDNLLIYARNLESKSEFSMSEIPINQLITDTIQALQPSVELKKIMISHTVGPSAKIMGIKDLLATMIRNILSNAIKFTEDQGAIEVSTRITKNFVDIIIKDNGIGMNNDLISNIFENSKSRPGTVGETGKGYGLMLSKEVAEKHEGNISVSSIPEKGTIFTIKLPLFKA